MSDSALQIVGKLRLRLKVILVGELKPPYIQAEKKFPFDPNESTIEHRKSLDMKAPAFWLVDTRTGRVLTKQVKLRRLA